MKYTEIILSPVRRQQINEIGVIIKMRSVIFFLFIHHTIIVCITVLLTLSCCSHLILHTTSHSFLHLSTSTLRLCTYGIFYLSMHGLRKANRLIMVNRLEIFVVYLLNQINMLFLHFLIIITNIHTICCIVLISDSRNSAAHSIPSCSSTHTSAFSVLFLLDSRNNICV